jgi:hypothetical protein
MKVRDGKYYGLYKLIGNEDILFGAYHMIKSNPGNMTPGSDGQTLDGISKTNKKKNKKLKRYQQSLRRKRSNSNHIK